MVSEFALSTGVDAVVLERALRDVHDEFVSTGLTPHGLRDVVRESWLRSVDKGLDPEALLAPIGLGTEALDDIRRNHPLAVGMPVVRRLLVESAADAGLLVAVSDAAGQLLWVEGASALRSRAEAMHFVEGANWSEPIVGTNAPGTSLALDRPVQILGAEHLARSVTDWSCSAAPIHDPDTGAVLGVLDLTGGTDVVTPQSLNLVRATVAAMESEIRIQRLTAPRSRFVTAGWGETKAATDVAQLEVLGERGARLSFEAGAVRLSLRHSELMLLLSSAGRGRTAAELAVDLSEDDCSEVTIRAELSRLRSVIGPVELGSRPYRLLSALHTDVQLVRSELAAGQLRAAVANYRGPILPQSTAPAVVAMRDELHMLLRSALLASDDVDAVLSFADTDHGREDYDVWRRAVELLPVSSPRFVQVAEHAEKLEAELSCWSN